MADDIPGFERDPELEELLDQDVLEMDEDTRTEVQLYKSRLLQAKRDADMSTDKPPWADGGTGGADETSDSSDESAPESSEESDGETSGEDVDEEPEEEASPDEEEQTDSTDAEVDEDIPGFDPDPEMEELLEKDIQDVDEDKRVEVQKYKSRKMKAKQQAKDAGGGSEESSDSTDTSADEPSSSEAEGESSEEESSDEGNIDFEEDPELEELLEKDIMELDEDKRVEVQKYKSRKMKAKRAARDGESGDSDSGKEASEDESTASDEVESDDEKAAPPADDEKRHDGERKIKEIVESRTSGREVSRRGFLSSFGLGTAGFLGVLGLGGISTGRFFFPNVMSNPPEQFVAGEPGDYSTNTVSDQYKGQYRVWIVNLGDRIVAINAICTHLGCTPNWLSGQGIFKCPCHGSGYYMSGVNFEGPAPRPMDRVGIRLSPTGKIIVDKSMKFAQQAAPGWEAKSAYIPV